MDARESTLRDMIRDFPDSPLPHFSLGNYLLEVGRFEEAIASLEAALRLDPQYAAALLALGDARAAIDDKDLAREAYERCAAAGLAQGHPELAQDARNRIDDL
jgi:tetratricopeptide (TPR) repeat protein